MNKLERYLDEHEGKEIESSIYEQYADFDYKNEELYKLNLDFMLKNLYNIRLVESTKIRTGQMKFRNSILNKFNGECIITGETCKDELTAAHIIPVSEEENYDVDNGLLLTETLHRTFDKHKWSINPNTMTIEINKNENVGSIKKYESKQFEFFVNHKMLKNLKNHYAIFLEKLN